MFSEYKKYLFMLRNNLIRCGIEFSEDVHSDVYDYFDLFMLSVKLEDIIYFYKILAISESKYCLSNFVLPISLGYKEKIRSICYNEFITEILPNYKKLSLTNDTANVGKVKNDYTEEKYTQVSNGVNLDDVSNKDELIVSRSGVILDEISSNDNDFILSKRGIVLDDIEELETSKRGIVLDDDSENEYISDGSNYSSYDEESNYSDYEESDYSSYEDDYDEEDDEASSYSSYDEESNYSDYDEEDDEASSYSSYDEDDEASSYSSYDEDDEDVSNIQTKGQYQKNVSNEDNTSDSTDLGTKLQDVTNSVLTKMKKSVISFLNRSE